MAAQHTPEPWVNRDDESCTHGVIDTDMGPARLMSWEDYGRALACVNACAGIPTETLEALGSAGARAAPRLAQLALVANQVAGDSH